MVANRLMAVNPDSGSPLLEVKDLQVHFDVRRGVIRALEGVNFAIQRSRTLGHHRGEWIGQVRYCPGHHAVAGQERADCQWRDPVSSPARS